MSEADYAGLITAAHHQLHAPVILIWDNLNTHVSAVMRAFTESHRDLADRGSAARVRPGSQSRRGRLGEHENGLGNLAARNVGELAAIVRNRLKRIQYRPALIDGFPGQTGLTLQPQPP